MGENGMEATWSNADASWAGVIEKMVAAYRMSGPFNVSLTAAEVLALVPPLPLQRLMCNSILSPAPRNKP